MLYCEETDIYLLFNFQCPIKELKKETQTDGGVAQLGEHLPCKQGVMGSIPIISTIFSKEALAPRLEK